jgi:hypothetical protein
MGLDGQNHGSECPGGGLTHGSGSVCFHGSAENGSVQNRLRTKSRTGPKPATLTTPNMFSFR